MRHDVSTEYLERGDEIGSLSKSMQTMSTSLRGLLKNITAEIQVLSSASAELSTNSGHMADGSRRASEKAHSVAAAAEEVSANVVSVATGMEQAAVNLTNVSSNTEEMTATSRDRWQFGKGPAHNRAGHPAGRKGQLSK